MNRTNLISYLPFDNSPIEDLCGKNWVARGTPTVSNGELQLDGASYLELTDGITLGGQDFTVAIWGKSTSDGGCVFLLAPDVGDPLGFYMSTGDFYIEIAYNHADETLYVSTGGNILDTSYSENFATRRTFNVTIGYGWGTYFTGTVSNFMIYDGTALHTGDFTPPTAEEYAVLKSELAPNTEIFTVDVERKLSNRVEVTADVERKLSNRVEFSADVEIADIPPIFIPFIGEHFNHYIASLKLFRGAPQKVILPKESKVYVRSGDGEPIRIFSDTDNIGKILEGDKYFGLEECETVFIQMESSPRQIIKNFIKFIVDNSSLLDKHIDLLSPMSGVDMMNAAINYITSGEFSTIKSLTDKFLADLNNSPTYTSFLRNYCDIILGNADTGAITGFDAGGAIVKTATSVVPETSSPENWTIPANGEVRVINGLTVHFPSYDEIFYVLPVSRKYILAGLNSEWIEQSLTLIYETLGLDFNSPTATIKDIYISFFNNIHGTLADISYTRSGYDISRIELQINMAYYEDVDTTSRDGRLVTSSPHYESAGYLDRTIAHELTHAVMASNISYFLRLPQYIIEGAAEIVHGIDDLRGGAIINLLTTRKSDLEYVLTHGGTPTPSDEEYEAESTYTEEDTYAAGYIFLRYLAKQCINNSDAIIITGLTICDSSTGDSTREELSLDTLRTVLKPLKTYSDVEILDVIPVDFNADINRAILAKIFLFPIFRGDS